MLLTCHMKGRFLKFASANAARRKAITAADGRDPRAFETHCRLEGNIEIATTVRPIASPPNTSTNLEVTLMLKGCALCIVGYHCVSGWIEHDILSLKLYSKPARGEWIQHALYGRGIYVRLDAPLRDWAMLFGIVLRRASMITLSRLQRP